MAFGFVLVGGRSSRMGRDKSLLPFRGRPLAAHQAHKLAFVCGRVALVGKDAAPFAGLPFPFVNDGAVSHASALGVLAALSWSPEDLNIVIGTDTPRLSEAFLASLLDLAAQTSAPVLLPTVAGHPQSLCGVWRKSALPALAVKVSEGEFALVRLATSAGGVVLTEEETADLPGSEPEHFLNVNTPEDYAALEAQDVDATFPPRI